MTSRVVADPAAKPAGATSVRVPLAVLAVRRPSMLARVVPEQRKRAPVEVAAFNSSI